MLSWLLIHFKKEVKRTEERHIATRRIRNKSSQTYAVKHFIKGNFFDSTETEIEMRDCWIHIQKKGKEPMQFISPGKVNAFGLENIPITIVIYRIV